MSNETNPDSAGESVSDRPFPHLNQQPIDPTTDSAAPATEPSSQSEATQEPEMESPAASAIPETVNPPSVAEPDPAVSPPTTQPQPPQQVQPAQATPVPPQSYEVAAEQPAPGYPQQPAQPEYPPQTYPPQGYETAPGAAGYGQQPSPQLQQPSRTGQEQIRTGPTDNSAAASLICGVVGVIFSCAWGIGGLLGMIAVIMGMNARRRLSKPGCQFRGEGMALTGIIFGWVSVGISVVVLGLFTLLAVTAGS